MIFILKKDNKYVCNKHQYPNFYLVGKDIVSLEPEFIKPVSNIILDLINPSFTLSEFIGNAYLYKCILQKSEMDQLKNLGFEVCLIDVSMSDQTYHCLFTGDLEIISFKIPKVYEMNYEKFTKSHLLFKTLEDAENELKYRSFLIFYENKDMMLNKIIKKIELELLSDDKLSLLHEDQLHFYKKMLLSSLNLD